mmetsp:Transcript_5393/g.15794  ORF Transcript_5393/g.15794 Transcript_5393/m.15794 type:complete len:448 (+) Transcript_5393:313-1656(+)
MVYLYFNSAFIKRRSKIRQLVCVVSFLLCIRLFSLDHVSHTNFGVEIHLEQKFLIPFLKGQGFNNQLWEYRTAAIIARATGRTLCLEPFHKFYLQKGGRQFLPFDEIFDVASLNNYVRSIVGGGNCARMCDHTLNDSINLVDKPTKMGSGYLIPDWRPGSLKKFRESTGFRVVPLPKQISIAVKNDEVPFDSFSKIQKQFQEFSHRKCLAISGPLIELEEEFVLWTKFLRVSKVLSNLHSQIISHFFSQSPYMAIHWRLEETKCAGIGAGIGYGRDAKAKKAKKNYIIRKSDKWANLCFYGVNPRSSPPKVWFRLLSKEAVANWILSVMRENNIQHAYLATDLEDKSILEWVKTKIHAISKIDILDILDEKISVSDNDIISVVEQEICSEANLFAGTQMSSWTERVIEKRFSNLGRIFSGNKLDRNKRLDSLNTTYYFDVEVCACEI